MHFVSFTLICTLVRCDRCIHMSLGYCHTSGRTIFKYTFCEYMNQNNIDKSIFILAMYIKFTLM